MYTLTAGKLRTIADGNPRELALLELVRDAGWPVDDPTAHFAGERDDSRPAHFTVHVGPRRGIVGIVSTDATFAVQSYTSSAAGGARTGNALSGEVCRAGLTHAEFLELIETQRLDSKIQL